MQRGTEEGGRNAENITFSSPFSDGDVRTAEYGIVERIILGNKIVAFFKLTS